MIGLVKPALLQGEDDRLRRCGLELVHSGIYATHSRLYGTIDSDYWFRRVGHPINQWQVAQETVRVLSIVSAHSGRRVRARSGSASRAVQKLDRVLLARPACWGDQEKRHGQLYRDRRVVAESGHELSLSLDFEAGEPRTGERNLDGDSAYAGIPSHLSV